MKKKLTIAYALWCGIAASIVFAANAENIRFSGYEPSGQPWGRGVCDPKYNQEGNFVGCQGGTPNCVMVQTYIPKCSGSGSDNCPDPMYPEVGSASCSPKDSVCGCRKL